MSPKTGSSKNISEEILEVLNSILKSSNVRAIGCDGTNVNTGTKNGVIVALERALSRRLQWIVCQLHGNELPLRHLMQKLDGKTSGPTGFTEEIGKALKDFEKLAVNIHFTPITTEFTNIDCNDLSTDQKYLLEIHRAVSQGVVDDPVFKRDPGTLNHSPWLTTANRLLRYYANPSRNLFLVAEYVMKVYAPVWFKIKCSPSVINGAKHLHEAIKKTRCLSPAIQEMVMPILQKNGYFAHSENVLLAMVNDENKIIGELGRRRVLRSRKLFNSVTNIRIFKIPNINFDADNFCDMIDWQNVEVTPPHCCMMLPMMSSGEQSTKESKFYLEMINF